MRRKDREVTNTNEILEIIKECKVCRLAMQDENGLYIVPLNFGYTYINDTLTLYFHSAKTGRKIKALNKYPNVAIEMDCKHALIESDIACGYGYAYKSIIGSGIVSFINDIEAKKLALSLLMQHQTGKDFIFTEEMMKPVSVFKVELKTFTGKQH
ncbi:MAG: pyridoxamine 5'-phosphate oxidase family protein [Coprobacillaceae bacterium]